MEIKEIFYINLHLKDGLEIISQIAKASWCQRESWYHFRYMAHIAILRVRHSYWGKKSRSRREYL